MSNGTREQSKADAKMKGRATERSNPGDEAPAGTPGTGENICPDCKGSGMVKARQCPKCGGTGVVIEGIAGG